MRNQIATPLLLLVFPTALSLISDKNVSAQTLTALHNFAFTDGAAPRAGLVLSDNILYGTTANYGSSDRGTVFAIGIDGQGFRVLHHFSRSFEQPSTGLLTNNDGTHPSSKLLLSGNTLYGTATYGGRSGWGTVFKVNTDGTGFATLHSFSAGAVTSFGFINSDGAYPYAGLIISGNSLYGTANYGGAAGSGTVFALKTDGTGFKALHHFSNAWALILRTARVLIRLAVWFYQMTLSMGQRFKAAVWGSELFLSFVQMAQALPHCTVSRLVTLASILLVSVRIGMAFGRLVP